VKRFIKLPLGSARNWSHVVDARSGPGIKSVSKAKKQGKVDDSGIVAEVGEGGESPDKFKRKHVYERKRKTPTDLSVRQRNPSIDISPFLDMSFWKREKICCGTIFRAPNGEVAVDVRYISPCENCKKSKNPMFKFPTSTKESSTPEVDVSVADDGNDAEVIASIENSSPFESQNCSGVSVESDEGFFDKRCVNTGLFSSPPEIETEESVQAQSEC